MKTSIIRESVWRRFRSGFVYGVLMLALLTFAPLRSASAQDTAPPMGTTQNFAVLAYSTVTNTGPTIVTGDLGVDPGTAITGFPPGTVVGGTTHSADAVALQAQSDNTTAYNDLAAEACNTNISTDLGGLTLVPGVYCFTSAAQLTGTLTLNAGGNANAVWIFKIGSTLITASNSSVVLENGAQQCNVFWQVGSSATLGTGTNFVGNIFALASVTLDTGAMVSGRALAQTGAVTMDSNTVSVTVCAAPITPIPPTLGKAFNPATILAGGGSTLTITLSNADVSAATLSSPLTDTLPSGLVVTGSASTTCVGGTASTTASSVTLTGGTIPANGSCDLTVGVLAASGGSYINSLAAGALKTNNGNNAGPAVATLTVTTPASVVPTIGKTFTPATINAGGGSTLIITLSNAGPTATTLTSPLVDTMPSGLVIAASPAPSTTCAGGVASATASAVTLTGGTIPANGACTVTVNVTAATGGNFINTIAAGALMTGNGNNAGPAIATLTVNTPAAVLPTVGKAFGPASIKQGGSSTLVITLSNAGITPDVLSAPFVDTMPSGLVVAATPAPSTTCVGGTVTSTTSKITLTGGTIPAAGSCTITATVTAAAGGNYINSLAAGSLQTNNGANSGPAIATLTVASATGVTVGKSFSPATIIAGGSSTLTITLSNAGTAATMTAPLTDTMPTGLVVSGSPTTTCGGVASSTPSTVTLTGGTIPVNGSCTLTVGVTAAIAGSYFNSLASGALQTNNGNSPGAAVSTLNVNIPANLPMVLTKSFSPPTIQPGGVSTLTVTMTNPNSTPANLTLPLTDYLPSGMVVYTTGSTNCGGKYSSKTGGNSVTVSGGSIPANGSRTLTVTVTAAAAGTYINTMPAGALQTNLGSNITAAVATLNVVSPALILTKSFSPSTIQPGGTSTLTITMTNPNSKPANLTGTLTDYLPAGMTIYTTGSTDCGGKYSGKTGGTSVTVSGGSIPANGSRTVTAVVTVTKPGSYVNTLPIGSLQTNLGNNTSSAVATLIVNAPVTPPTLAKSFTPSTITTGGLSLLTITLSNANSSAASITAPLIDNLPSGVLIASTPYASTTCSGGTVTAKSGAAIVTLKGGSIPANGTCTVTVKVTANYSGSCINTIPAGALQTSNGNNAAKAVATLTVNSSSW